MKCFILSLEFVVYIQSCEIQDIFIRVLSPFMFYLISGFVDSLDNVGKKKKKSNNRDTVFEIISGNFYYSVKFSLKNCRSPFKDASVTFLTQEKKFNSMFYNMC